MSEIKLIIDGKEVQTTAGETILNAALENGIYIPHLCSKEELHPAGACRLCMVEIAGREGVVPSCATRAEEGMHVNTHSPAAEEIRKLCCDFIFKRHPPECTGCVKYGKCQLQSISQYVGDTGIKLRAAQLEIPENAQDPVICHDMQRCILCGRCVRVAYIDESAAMTVNKNKWKNWNLVLRKATREKWGMKDKHSQEGRILELDEKGRLIT